MNTCKYQLQQILTNALGNYNNPFVRTCKLPQWVCKCSWCRSMSFYGPLCREEKERICFAWHMSVLTSAWEVQVDVSFSYRDLRLRVCALVPFRVEETLDMTQESCARKSIRHNFCPRDVGQQSPEEATLWCEWQACRVARVGAGSVHTPADVRECTSGNSMPQQPRSSYLKTALQFLLHNFVEGL